jgi:hypothetical protein
MGPCVYLELEPKLITAPGPAKGFGSLRLHNNGCKIDISCPFARYQ